MSWRPNACMATTRPSRSWPKARPTPADVGFMCAMTGRSVEHRRRRRCSITHATAKASIRGSIWPDIAGLFQADAFDGYRQLYVPDRSPGRIIEAACWVHARRPFFAMADLDENARRKAAGKKEIPLSPIAIEVVRRIDALFEIERPINGKNADERRAVRQKLSKPLVDELLRLHARAARQTLPRP